MFMQHINDLSDPLGPLTKGHSGPTSHCTAIFFFNFGNQVIW